MDVSNGWTTMVSWVATSFAVAVTTLSIGISAAAIAHAANMLQTVQITPRAATCGRVSSRAADGE